MPSTPYPQERLHVEVSGPEEAPPLLVLHGWGASAALMRPVARALAPDHRVFNVDLPGHGQSPPPPEPWGVPEYAALVAELIDARTGGGPVPVVGHSNGGRIALYMAGDGELQGRIGPLALVSPSGVRRERTWRYHLKRGVAEALKAPVRLLPSRRLRQFAHENLRYTLAWQLLGSSDYRQLEGVMRDTFVKTVNCYVEDRLPHVRVPVLLFWGDRDEAVTRQQMRVLEERLPDAGLVVLEDAGHYGFLDAPDTFLTATRHFLEEPYEAPEEAEPALQ